MRLSLLLVNGSPLNNGRRHRRIQFHSGFPVFHPDSYQSLTKAIRQLEKRGQPRLFRVSRMQRCVWAQMEGGALRLHGSHASSPENLARVVEIFEREGGRRPGNAREVTCC